MASRTPPSRMRQSPRTWPTSSSGTARSPGWPRCRPGTGRVAMGRAGRGKNSPLEDGARRRSGCARRRQLRRREADTERMPCGVSAGSRRAPAAGGPPAGRPRAAARGHGVEVVLDQVAECVQPGLADRGERGVRRRHEPAAGDPRDLGEERPAEPVVLQRAVPGGAEDGAARPPSRNGSPPGRRDDAVVDLVAVHRLRRAPCRAAGPASSRREPTCDRQQPQPGTEPAPRLDVVGRSCAPASGSRRRCRAPAAGRGPRRARRRRGRASRSQPRSATVARVPGSTTRSASASSSGAVTKRTTTPGSAASASTSVKLDIRGQPDDATRSTSSPQRAARAARRAVEAERVLDVEPKAGAPRQDAEHRPAGQRARACRGRARAAASHRGTC